MTERPGYRVSKTDRTLWRDVTDPTPHRPASRDVEITGIETMAIEGNYDWGMVIVRTNADTAGIGETYPGRGALDVVERVGELLVGENPLDVRRLVTHLTHRYPGSGRFGRAAFAGIEIALWDLKGKLLDVPVYELLGGTFREQVPTYVDVHGGEPVGEAVSGEASDIYTPKACAMAAREAVDDGFESLKFDLDVPYHAHKDTAARRLDDEAIDHKEALVQAIRDEVGNGIELSVDLHFSFTVETAVRLGRRLEPYDLSWLEDPVPPEKTLAHSRIREQIDVPVLTGENLVTATAFDDLGRAGGFDIGAPDVTKCGLIEFLEICAVCDRYGAPVAPHNLTSPVGLVATVHACAAVANAFCVEYRGYDVPWWGDLVSRIASDESIVKDGAIAVPQGPGLGVEIDPDVAASYLADDCDLLV